MIDLTHSCDMVVTTRPPAHFIRHPKKVAWFWHHLRAYYDLWDSEFRHCPDDEKHRGLRDTIRAADTKALSQFHSVFVNSTTMQKRLHEFNGIDSKVLLPPLRDPEIFQEGPLGDAIVCVCRIESHKRQHLLVEAFRHVNTKARLVIRGVASDKAYLSSLHALVKKYRLKDRVSIQDGWISDADKAELLSNALANAYVPFDEDSYGFPTIEAAASGKPTLTLSDSGGVLEFVRNRETGIVAEPTPVSISQAVDLLHANHAATSSMGKRARDEFLAMKFDWNNVVEQLIS